MKNTQQRVLQALRRVLGFGAANPTIIPPATGPSDTWTALTRQYAQIGTIVEQVTDAASEQLRQAANTKLAATSEPVLRTTLREEMHTITQVAQAVKKTVPGIGILKMPANTLPAEAMLKYADALKKQASTYESVLIEHGLAEDFSAQLQGAITALRTSIDARGVARTAQVGATRQIAGGIALGLQYIHVMDASLTKALKANPPKLAEWKNVKRVTIKGVISTSSSTSITGTTTPAVTTQAAGATPQSSATSA